MAGDREANCKSPRRGPREEPSSPEAETFKHLSYYRDLQALMEKESCLLCGCSCGGGQKQACPSCGCKCNCGNVPETSTQPSHGKFL